MEANGKFEGFSFNFNFFLILKLPLVINLVCTLCRSLEILYYELYRLGKLQFTCALQWTIGLRFKKPGLFLNRPKTSESAPHHLARSYPLLAFMCTDTV